MKKITIITIIILIIGGTIYFVWSKGYLKNIIPGSSKEEYKYKDEDLKKISEEAGINLEKGMSEDDKSIYDNQKEDLLVNKIDILYRGKLILNPNNSKEWLVRVPFIVSEENKKYGIWKKNTESENIFIGNMNQVMYGEWEYKSENTEELKGVFIIGSIGENNSLQSIQYILEK